MKSECYFALIDYILEDDMYKTYPGLGDTIRGFWDNYDARIVAGICAPLISILLSNAFYCLIITNRIIIDSSCISLNLVFKGTTVFQPFSYRTLLERKHR